jgi:hypothetical protein
LRDYKKEIVSFINFIIGNTEHNLAEDILLNNPDMELNFEESRKQISNIEKQAIDDEKIEEEEFAESEMPRPKVLLPARPPHSPRTVVPPNSAPSSSKSNHQNNNRHHTQQMVKNPSTAPLVPSSPKLPRQELLAVSPQIPSTVNPLNNLKNGRRVQSAPTDSKSELPPKPSPVPRIGAALTLLKKVPSKANISGNGTPRTPSTLSVHKLLYHPSGKQIYIFGD